MRERVEELEAKVRAGPTTPTNTPPTKKPIPPEVIQLTQSLASKLTKTFQKKIDLLTKQIQAEKIDTEDELDLISRLVQKQEIKDKVATIGLDRDSFIQGIGMESFEKNAKEVFRL